MMTNSVARVASIGLLVVAGVCPVWATDYYVNDGLTNGDVYTTGVGVDTTTNGLDVANPMLTLTNLMVVYNVQPGDVIWVDTGYYAGYTVTITTNENGTGSSPVIFRGSTNWAVRGSLFDRQSLANNAFVLLGPTRHVRMENFYIAGANNAVRFNVTFGASGGIPTSNEFIRVTAFSNAVGFALFGGRYLDFRRCVAAKNGTGWRIEGGPGAQIGNTWDHGVSWSNSLAFSAGATDLSVSNSIIIGGNAFSTQLGPTVGDYNIFWKTSIKSGVYEFLSELQQDEDGWWHSTVADPGLIDPQNLDFHPRSTEGRYDLQTEVYVTNDLDTGLAVDFGDRQSPFSEEPGPNGSRLNAGVYGNTREASKSPSDPRLVALTHNDGGDLLLGGMTYWHYLNIATDESVRVEFSGNSGGNWTVVASNVLVSDEVYLWTNSEFASTRFARWRVILESDTNVMDETDNDMIFRNGGFTYYVNDNSTDGDVYTDAVGDNNALGTDPGGPKSSVARVLDDYALGAGDVIFVDTGVYKSNTTLTIDVQDKGTNGNPVIIQGSTNSALGGATIFKSASLLGLNSAGIDINGTEYVAVRNITVEGRKEGVLISNATGIELEGVLVFSNAASGIRLVNAVNPRLLRVASWFNGLHGVEFTGASEVTVENGVIYKNKKDEVHLTSGQIILSNTVVVASGPTDFAFSAPSAASVIGDYNDIYAMDHAVVGYVSSLNRVVDTLGAWMYETGSDAHSLSVDPRFADPARGDFHLQTETILGRFDPVQQVYVNDAETSLLIDSGSPQHDVGSEPEDNGDRINMGLYGGTAEASRGRTFAWVHAASLRQGGWVKGTSVLHWVAVDFTNGAQVDVAFSPDGGYTWNDLTNGALASQEAFTWNTTAESNTPSLVWRVTGTEDPGLTDATTNFSAIRNAPLSIYINDGSTNEDVYANAEGAPTNWPATQDKPLHSLATAFTVYDIEPGDTLFVDTGTYAENKDTEIGRLDAGTRTGLVVTIRGSTNWSGSGTVLDRLSTASGTRALNLVNVRGISISNITFLHGSLGIRMEQAQSISFGFVESRSSSSNGLEARFSTNIVFRNGLLGYNDGYGVWGHSNAQVRVLQSVVWSNRSGALFHRGGSVATSNSVLTANGLDHVIFNLEDRPLFRSDYNDLLDENQANIARIDGKISKSVGTWQERTTNDLHTLTHDPLFAAVADLDFHPKSEMGRYDPATGSVVTDLVGETSLLIDTGDPNADFSNEPQENGGRLNIGRYGNTAQSSRSRTNAWVLALTFNDGGTVRGTNDLYFVAGGAATAELFYVDFSLDGGATWTNIATNVTAAAGALMDWDTTPFGSSPAALWRIVSQFDTNVFDDAGPFSLNNGPLAYYVNDRDSACDVYSIALGAGFPTNNGLSDDSPLLSIQEVFDRYEVQEGDVIFVDSGLYPLDEPFVVDFNTLGTATNPVVIQGSTNYGCGGTVFDGQGGSRGLDLNDTVGIKLSNLRVQNARTGIRLLQSTNIELQQVDVLGFQGGQQDVRGYEVNGSAMVDFNRCSVRGVTNHIGSSGLRIEESAGVVWRNGVIWSNFIGVDLVTSDLTVSNSIVGVFPEDGIGYSMGVGAAIQSEYNDLYMPGGAYIANQLFTIFNGPGGTVPLRFDNLALWVEETGNDKFSLSHDPLFADAGSADFHLLSEAGRYTWSMTNFVADMEGSSALIDAGNAGAAFDHEPDPNGARVNIGPFANTEEASKTPTGGVVLAVSLNDGGVVRGTNVVLYWLARGAATGDTVRLRYSGNNGKDWTTIQTNLPSTNSFYHWNTLSYTSTPFARWAVVVETDTNVADECDRSFTVRNEPFEFFVNDEDQSNDVYVNATGSVANLGLDPDSPMASLEQVLDAYDLEPGDRVFVDTGIYPMNGVLTIEQNDTGVGTNRLLIQGSTNGLPGATRFTGAGVRVDASRGLELRNLVVVQGTNSGEPGLEISQSSNTVVQWFSSAGGGSGFEIKSSVDSRLTHCDGRDAITNGLLNVQAEDTVWQSGVLWSNPLGVVMIGGKVTVSNSVIGVFNDGGLQQGGLVFDVSGTLVSDYNNFMLGDGILMGSEPLPGQDFPVLYENLGNWAGQTGRDTHSFNQDPLFVNPAAGDFHLRSEAGRFEGPGFVADAASSILIDAGFGGAAVSNEPPPDGERVNIGLYGNTVEASKTPANPVLFAITLSDGGRAQGTNWVLNWNARGAATGHTVRLEFSADGGETYNVIVSNRPAADLGYVWDTTLFTSTVLGVWAVISEADTNVLDRTDDLFAVRNDPIPFYVNDGSTNNDMYTFAVGSKNNFGIKPTAPKATIQGVLDAYDVEPLDTIFVDTGYYSNTTSIAVGQLDAGNVTNEERVVIQGSTAVQGSVLDRQGGNAGFFLNRAGAVEIRNFQIRNAVSGIQLSESDSAVMEWVFVTGGAQGFNLDDSPNVILRHCMAKETSDSGILNRSSIGTLWEQGVFWSNRQYAVNLRTGGMTVSNSVVVVFGQDRFAYNLGQQVNLQADKNNIQLLEGALAGRQELADAEVPPLIYQNVSRWARGTANDLRSLSLDPGFFAPASNDFHLLSQAGRFDPTVGSFITNDLETSFLIDAGSSFAAFTNEPIPNGGRPNIGLYGNTPEASMSPTNARLHVVSLNDGGRAEGTFQLLWIPAGEATGHTVRLEFSPDAGNNWEIVQTAQGPASNIPSRVGNAFWNTLAHTSTVRGLWRVVSESDTNVADQSDQPFAVRNEALRFFVNGNYGPQDIYTVAAGSPLNPGTAPNLPKDSIRDIVQSYDLEPGDTIFVDSDSYTMGPSDGINFGRFDAWDDFTNLAPLQAGGVSVTIQGSTNQPGATDLVFPEDLAALSMTQAYGVAVRNIRFDKKGAGTAARISESSYAQLEWVESVDARVGFDVQESLSVSFTHCTAIENQFGLSTKDSEGTFFSNGTLWSNDGYGVVQDDLTGSLNIENSAFGVFGKGAFGIVQVSGTLNSDYNSLFARKDGLVAAQITGGSLGGGTSRFLNVQEWIRESGQDQHSLTKDPRFFDPGVEEFHPQSPAGRFQGGVYVTNPLEEVSSLLAAGNPGSDFSLEPDANGGRVNIGLYGNTVQASKVPPEGILNVVSLNDGGSIDGVVTLRWVAAGAILGSEVYIDFSPDGGATWTNIATNVSGSAESVIWNSVDYGRAAAGRWRVVSEDDESFQSTNDIFFSLRNPVDTNSPASIPYYVNDFATNGDVYCNSPGLPNNDGFLPSTPKDSLITLLRDVNLEPGDVVFIDTGSYATNESVIVGDFDAGQPDLPVLLQCSTNHAAGGSVFDRITKVGNVIHFDRTLAIEIRDAVLQNGDTGLRIDVADDCVARSVRAVDNLTEGFLVINSRDALITGSFAHDNGTNGLRVVTANAVVENSVIWNNPSAISLGLSADLVVRNSALNANGIGEHIFDFSEQANTVTSDYNNIVRTGGALLAERVQSVGGNLFWPKLIDWQRDQGQDLNSMSEAVDLSGTFPIFVDALNGDFHLRSAEGRFLDSGELTNDPAGVFSPMLDTGDPLAVFTNEPAPNGSNINIAAYGNSAVASLSQTNPWVLAKTLNDGGIAFGTQDIVWAFGGMDPTSTVHLSLAPDGVDFAPFVSNVPIGSLTYPMDISQELPTRLAKWKITSELFPGVEDEAGPFTIKNNVLTIYVNDDSTVGDIYSCTNCNPSFSGLSCDKPLCDPATALQKYELTAGDTVLIDTGIYNVTNPVGMVVGFLGDTVEEGLDDFLISIHGSTNGSLIIGGGTNSIGLFINQTAYIEADYLAFSGADEGVSVNLAENIGLRHIESFGNGVGIRITESTVIGERNIVHNNSEEGLNVAGSKSVVSWQQGVVWSNVLSGVSVVQGSLSLSNSIIGAEHENAACYIDNQAVIRADYNLLHVSTNGLGAVIARNLLNNETAANLKEWQVQDEVAGSSHEEHTVLNLGIHFVDTSNRDFHVRSEAGRFNPTTKTFVTNDTVTSWAIDIGSFDLAYDQEETPNGERANVGLYGSTVMASKSLTNQASRAIELSSLNDGGLTKGTQLVYWVTRGFSTSDLVYIDFSADGGATWVPVVSNISAVTDGYEWNTTDFDSTPLGRLRVSSVDDPPIHDTNIVPFANRQAPFYYYVNDSSTSDDIYTMGVGSSENNGLSKSNPVDRISDIFDRYNLEGGDIVFVDTGFYSITNPISIKASDGGTTLDKVSVIGSTNRVGLQTIVHKFATNAAPDTDHLEAAIEMFRAGYVSLSDLVLEEGDNSLVLIEANFGAHSNLLVRESRLAGVQLTRSGNNTIRNSVITRTKGVGIQSGSSGPNFFEHVVIWSNKTDVVRGSTSTIIFSNSVLHAFSTNVIFSMNGAEVSSDFNDLYVEDSALYAVVDGFEYEGLPQWLQSTSNDVHSLGLDPLFADAANDDYHLLSQNGRWQNGGYSAFDLAFSYLLDTGATNAPFELETDPNGGRVNMGLYGNTAESSLSRLTPWLLAITASSGGRIGDLFHLVWAFGGMDETNGVSLDFSYDDGVSWVNIDSNVVVGNGEYLWNSVAEPLAVSPIARWRIVLEADTNVMDVTDFRFGLNGPFQFFVNDTDVTLQDDIFTTAPGDDANQGIFSNAPKATLASLLASNDVDGLDEVFIDSGLYPITSNDLVFVGLADGGREGEIVDIRGSDNGQGVLFQNVELGSPDILSIAASFVNVSNIFFNNGGVVGVGTNLIFRNLSISNGLFSLNGAIGLAEDITLDGGTINGAGADLTMRRFVAKDSSLELSGSDILVENTVLHGSVSPLISSRGTNISIRNSTIVADQTAFRQFESDSSATLRNNILVANGAQGDAFCILLEGGVLASDYNNLVARNGAWIGTASGNWERLLYWQRQSGLDPHSIAADPAFINEAGGDFHLKSTTGTFVQGFGFLPQDADSPAIDAGDPFIALVDEQDPNGGRVNIGAYGNTSEASLSRTNPWLFAITMNDGGVLKGTSSIRWLSANIELTNTLLLQYSPNGGGTWTTFASVDGSSTEYLWDTTTVTSSLDALWRVMVDADTNVQDTVNNEFSLRNDPLIFFVNDNDVAGDQFTGMGGQPFPGHDGRSSNAPVDNLMGILTNYDTEAGDTILVDVGYYPLSNDVLVIWSDGGDQDGNLLIQGASSNGEPLSVISRGSSAVGNDGIDVKASQVVIRELAVQNAYRGILLDSNRFSTVERVLAQSNRYGIAFSRTLSATAQNVRVWNNTLGGIDLINTLSSRVENVTHVGNAVFGTRVTLGVNDRMQNNIYYITTTNTQAIAINTGALVNAFIDYNQYHFAPGSDQSSISAGFTNLTDWQLAAKKDYRSDNGDPLFADVDAGDFHLQSTAGRFQGGVWVNDVQNSPAIDRGNPDSTFVLEPETNGNRLNIGAYGNTEFASKGSTGSLLFARTANTPLQLTAGNDEYPLIWNVLNLPTGVTVTVQYSGDNGGEWINLATGVPADQEFIIWDIAPIHNSFKGRWRVIIEEPGDTNILDISDANIQLFIGQFEISKFFRGPGTNTLTYRAAWDENYTIQFAETRVDKSFMWTNIPGGSTNLSIGGDVDFSDVTFTGSPYRVYRVLWEQTEE